jgi:TetR/AcrR family transcriptional regulator, transcriptional repressor for nem operon
MPEAQARHDSKTRILNAAMHVIRAKGYSAATVDDVCAEADLTKGSFFHHFKSKEELAVAAAAHFAQMADRLFANAPFAQLPDPYDRLMGYVDFRRSILRGNIPDYTCLLGTMVQEAYETYPGIRDACNTHISAHAAHVAQDIAAAKALYAPDANWGPESVGLFTQAVLQGAFILAKAKNGPEVAMQCVDHLKRYLDLIFNQPRKKEGASHALHDHR